MWKKFLISLVLIVFCWNFNLNFVWAAPTFDATTEQLEDKTYSKEKIGIKEDQTFIKNVKEIFYPNSAWGSLWDFIRNVWVGIFLIFFVRAGILLLFNAGDESKIKQYKTNFVYIIYWALLFFGSLWIISTWLKLPTTQADKITENLESNVLFFVLSFLKSAAFFLAIVMIMYYWFKIIQSFDNSDKIKEARKWVINIIIALVFIKIVDFVFYIANKSDFETKSLELIISVSKILWFVI